MLVHGGDFAGRSRPWQGKRERDQRSAGPRLKPVGAGAPLTIDLEQTCGRAGLQIIAAVRNRPGEVFTLHPEKLVDAATVSRDLPDVPFVCGLACSRQETAAVRSPKRSVTACSLPKP